MKLAPFGALAVACALLGCSTPQRPAASNPPGTLPGFDHGPSVSDMIRTETAQIRPEWAKRFRTAQTASKNPALTFGLFHLPATLGGAIPKTGEWQSPGLNSEDTRLPEDRPEAPGLAGKGNLDSQTPDWAAEVRQGVSPDSWKAPGTDAFVDGDALVVFQAREILAEIPAWLAKREQETLDASPLLKVESTFVELSPETQLQLMELIPAGATRCSDNALALAPGPAKQIHQWLTQDPGRSGKGVRSVLALAPRDVTCLSAPTLTTFDGQKGSIVISSQKAYIADRVEAIVDGLPKTLPVVAVAHDGVTMATRGHRVPETGKIDLEVATTVMRIESIDDIDTALGRIQAARTAQQTAGTKASLEPGGALLLTGLTGKSGRPVIVLLRVTPVTGPVIDAEPTSKTPEKK